MFYLEKKEPTTMPNILGNASQPVPTYRWKAIYTCPERKPLEALLEKMDKSKYRITTNNPPTDNSSVKKTRD